jgi:hypothetical protein
MFEPSLVDGLEPVYQRSPKVTGTKVRSSPRVVNILCARVYACLEYRETVSE